MECFSVYFFSMNSDKIHTPGCLVLEYKIHLRHCMALTAVYSVC